MEGEEGEAEIVGEKQDEILLDKTNMLLRGTIKPWSWDCCADGVTNGTMHRQHVRHLRPAM